MKCLSSLLVGQLSCYDRKEGKPKSYISNETVDAGDRDRGGAFGCYIEIDVLCTDSNLEIGVRHNELYYNGVCRQGPACACNV